ncbi:MAG TPA: hypothetical protein PLB01_01090 [Thermoanaerobaculia bacterium]|nr:hypothetical protein [Thermoanaerobaculia bacterium]
MAPYEETLFILAVLSFGAFVAWLAARHALERARERDRRGRFVEAQIEKFGEARDFVEFARSEAGLAWLRADSGETRARRGLLVLTVVGILAIALGAGLLVNAARLAGAADPNDALSRTNAAWWGTVLVAVGAGSLAASALIARIGRAWGLVPHVGTKEREAGGE